MTTHCTNHEPAMTLPEAALLPAMAAPGYPAMPLNAAHFRPVEAACTRCKPRCGSIAGRAVLHTSGVHLPGVSCMRCPKRHP